MAIYWLSFTIASLATGFVSNRCGVRKISKSDCESQPESTTLNDDVGRFYLHDRYQPLSVATKDTDNYYETVNDSKNKVLRYLNSILSWCAWGNFSLILSCLGAFNVIPFWITITLSFMLLLARFWMSIYNNCPISVRNKRGDRKRYRKIMSTMLHLHKKKIIGGLFLLLSFILLTNLGTYQSCANDHVADNASYGFGGGLLAYNSAFTRFLYVSKVCPPGPPCHVYATLPFDTSTSVFMNVHTNSAINSITINYDTNQNFNSTGKLALSASSSHTINPGYDLKGERNVHTVLLNNLSPDTEYAIQIYYDGDVKFNSTYKTLPDATSTSSFNLIYGGDIGVSNLANTLSDISTKYDPHAYVIGGDLAYDDGSSSCYYTMDMALWMFESKVFAKLNRIVPLIFTIGNHDVGYDSLSGLQSPIDENGPTYFNIFPQHLKIDPKTQAYLQEVPHVSERNAYHAHLIGKTLSLSLDSGYYNQYSGAQLDWIKNISQTYKDYKKIAIYHDPIMSPCQYPIAMTNMGFGLENWIPAFDQYNFVAAFEHHSHYYKRTFPLREMRVSDVGTVFLGNGNWGINPFACNFGNDTKIFANYSSLNHFFVVHVDQATNQISYSPVGADGNLIDSVSSQDLSKFT